MSGRDNDRNGLSSEARALLSAARDADGPTSGDRERVRRALAVAIAASAGTAGATLTAASGGKAIVASTAAGGTASATAVGAAGATAVGAGAVTASLLTKVVIAVVAISVGSGVILAANRYATSPTRDDEAALSTEVVPRVHELAAQPVSARQDAPVDEPAGVVVPPSLTDAPTAPSTEVTEVTEPTPAVTARRPHVARATPHDVEDEGVPIADEYAVLRDARSPSATPARRLASIDAHAARFPRGQMAGDRDDYREQAVRALCAQGPEAVTEYLAAHPSSSSAPMLRATCPDESH